MTASSVVSSRRTAADVALQLVGRVVNIALGVVVTAVLTRALGASDFGRWTTILVVVSLAESFTRLGLDEIAVRGAAADPDREGEWMAVLVLARGALAFIAMAVSMLVVSLLAEGPAMLLAGILVTASLVIIVPTSLRAVFQLRVRNDIPVAVMTLNSVLWGAGVLIVATTAAGLATLAAVFLATTVFQGLLLAWLALRSLRGRLSLRGGQWRDLTRLGLPAAIGGLIIIAYARVDAILVFKIAGERDAGQYGAVYKIVESAHFIPISLTTTLFPLIATAWPSDPERARNLSRRALDFLLIGSLPALAFTVVAAKPTVRFMFGSDFAEAAPLLPVLMLAFVLICCSYLTSNLIFVLELQRRFIPWAALALVVNVVLNLLLLPRYGAIAAAWVTVVTEVAVLIPTALLTFPRMGIRPDVARAARALVAAAGMAGVVAVLAETGLHVLLLGVAAALLYPVLLLATRTLGRDEIAALAHGRAPA